MTMNSIFDNVSIAQDDFRYYVKSPSDVVDSAIEPVSSDSRYNRLPAKAVLWDSVAKYWSNFESLPIVTFYPAAFKPDPRTGNYQNLYLPENQFPVPWDTTVYDPSTTMTFPKGFLRPAVPATDFSLDPYEPPLELEIPDVEPPEPLVPALILTDTAAGKGVLKEIEVDTDICLDTSVSYSSDSTVATVHINWATPPPTTGIYVAGVINGSCAWIRVRNCQTS